MRFITFLFCLLSIIAVAVQASRVKDLVSEFLANQPTEVQSALISEFSDLTTNTSTDRSVLSSVSSALSSAAESANSELSSVVSSIESSLTVTKTSNAAVAGSSYSTLAAFGALLLSVVFFQAL